MAEVELLVSVACGGWGDPELPQHPSEIVGWIRSFKATIPVPEWVLEMIETLRANESEVEFAYTKIRKCDCTIALLHILMRESSRLFMDQI